jgi:hypothetical protein
MHNKYIISITYECHDNAPQMWKVVQLEKYFDFSLYSHHFSLLADVLFTLFVFIESWCLIYIICVYWKLMSYPASYNGMSWKQYIKSYNWCWRMVLTNVST